MAMFNSKLLVYKAGYTIPHLHAISDLPPPWSLGRPAACPPWPRCNSHGSFATDGRAPVGTPGTSDITTDISGTKTMVESVRWISGIHGDLLGILGGKHEMTEMT